MKINYAFFFSLAIIGLLSLEFSGITAAAVKGCPAGYSFAGGYCVENACQNPKTKCMKQGTLIKRPDCHCTAYLGKLVCGIKGGQKTAVKMPTCTRRGHLNSVCGAYDSSLKKCVLK